jgi:acetoin utilization deacetylase AcuC-like enzyme
VKKTGVFFHDLCRDKDIHWLLRGRLSHFPSLLGELGILDKPNIELIESPGAPLQLLEQVHAEEMVKRVELDPYFDTALHSTGGTIVAGERITMGEIDNAFVFTGSADHHAGHSHYWGAAT